MSEGNETKQASANRISPELDRNRPYFNLPPDLAESRITILDFHSSRAHNNPNQRSIGSDLTTNSGSSSSTASTAVSNLSGHSGHPAVEETAHSAVEETGPSQITPVRPLSSASRLQLVRRIPKQTLIRAGERNPQIWGMSYNSARNELFLADYNNGVRAMRVRDNAGDLRDVYRAPHDTYSEIYSVCHMSDSDTLLVCSGEYGPDRKRANWLVALKRNGIEWLETQRVQTDGDGVISCALSDSRVLIGGTESGTTYMELFRVKRGPRIARVHRILMPEEYWWFSATCGSDTLVAMSYPKEYNSQWDNSVRVHRLRGDRLEELARIQLKLPNKLLWLADRLLVTDVDREKNSDAVIGLEVSDTRLERRRELIATSENINLERLCAVNDGLAICDEHYDILHYSLI